MSLYADAVDNWPEDEASMSAEYALDTFENDGHDTYHQWLIRERDHWNKVFSDDALMNRFSARFNALTANVTNLYM